MNNGNLALFGQTTTQLWSSNSHQQKLKKQKKEKKENSSSSSSDSSSDEDDHAKNITFWCRKRDRLFQGSKLDIGDQLVSRNGVFNAVMQGDGNFVVYHNASKPIWASNTHGLHGNLHVIMQTDGNLVVYNPSNPGENEHPKWASNTCGMDSNCVLIIQDDGNLVLYGGSSTTLWASNSVHPI